MKLNKLFIILVSTLFLVLVACNTDTESNNDMNDMIDTNEKNDVTEDDDTVSSLNTDSSSNDYPHTVPIRIQDAKYKFKFKTNQENGNQQPQSTQFQTPQGQEQNQQNTQQQTEQQDQDQNQQDTQQQTKQQEQDQNQQNIQQQQGQEQNQQDIQQQEQTEAETPSQSQAKNGLSDFESSVIKLTNAERSKQGLPALQTDAALSKVARAKSQDTENKGYFSHTSPTYGSPFDMMRDFGVSYQSAGENIAQGQRTPEEVVNAWMNSEGHRANILNNKFTHIGVGFEEGGRHWTQMFIQK